MIRFNSDNSDYHLFNFLISTFVVAIVLVLKTEIITVKCVYADIGMQCRTCGLTTSFKEVLNGRFNRIPLGHFLLFILFTGQLLIRPLISWLLMKVKNIRVVRNTDIILFLILFFLTIKELLWES
jgi:hypothetical protein